MFNAKHANHPTAGFGQMETAYCLHPGPTWSVGVSLAHPSSDDGSLLNNCCHCASQEADLANISCQSTAVNALPQHSLIGKTATWSSTKVRHCAEFIQCSGSRIPRCTPDRLGQCQKECTPVGQPGASWNQPKPIPRTGFSGTVAIKTVGRPLKKYKSS